MNYSRHIAGQLRPETRFAGKQKFYVVATLILGTVSLLKGLRLPNLWSATQALINYDHGVIKRGLFGATLGKWLHLSQYAHFAVVSLLLLFLLLLLLAGVTLRTRVFYKVGEGEPICVFFASFALTYIAHLVGYLDLPLAILALALVAIRNPWLRFSTALPVCAIGLLVHELFLVVFLPVVLLTFVTDALESKDTASRVRLLAAALLLLFLCLGIAMKLSVGRPTTPVVATEMEAEMRRQTDFPVRSDLFLVLNRSAHDNFRLMKGFILKQPRYWESLATSVVILAPTIFLLCFAIVASIRNGRETGSLVMYIAAFVSAFSPLAMHAVAWDVERFNTWVVFTTFVTLLILSRRKTEQPVSLPHWFRNAALLTIALSMASAEGLMGGATTNPYPFLQGALRARDNLAHSIWTPPSDSADPNGGAK